MRTWVVLILGAVLGLAPAWAEKRAFIVGVSDYAELVDLKKTIGDAEGYATLFENELNFRVTPLHNPTRLQFSEAFGRFLDTVNPGDEVAFIFSGHGWSDGVENYLVFSDAPRQSSEYALKDQTKALTSGVLSAIRARGAHITFAIIDACRDYPFDSYGKTIYGRGLIRTPLSEGTLVVYAAGDSQVALDRLGPSDTSPYSVFTRVLLPKLRDKNRPLREILRETRGEVRALAQTINHTQRPAFYEDFDGDYCLGGYCSRTPQPSAASLRREQDRSAWQMASEINTLEAYTSYQKQHPYGEFAGDAAAMIDQLTPKEVCENVWQQTYVGQRMEKVHARKTVWGDGRSSSSARRDRNNNADDFARQTCEGTRGQQTRQSIISHYSSPSYSYRNIQLLLSEADPYKQGHDCERDWDYDDYECSAEIQHVWCTFDVHAEQYVQRCQTR